MSNDLKTALTDALTNKPEKTPANIAANNAKLAAMQPGEGTQSGKLGTLARNYIMGAVDSATRVPSPNLKNADFRALLLHWRAVLLASIAATKNHASAFTIAVQAIASSEGALQAKRLVDNVMGQVLWSAAVDFQRAETREHATAGDVEATLRERLGAYADEEFRRDMEGAPVGLDPERDPDNAHQPDTDEVMDALAEANGWLSAIADLLPADDAERLILGLEGGLPYTQRKEVSDMTGEATYVPVHDINEALEIQLEKNKASFAARTSKRMAAMKDTFAAIAKLAA
ncbi:MAG: hypothetical protein GX856_13980 [Gammaproteobacteria bacterium]|nr:hypothetical protein [Gammaproteobacteria bacterium]